jgi:hypothetical protein
MIRIMRECGRWRAGQTGSINAEYGRELIALRLAVEIRPRHKEAVKRR